MEQKTIKNQQADSIPPAIWVRLIIINLLIPVTLFLCSGDAGWWQGWIFSILIVAAGILSRIWAEHQHPGLLMERSRYETAEGVKPWDKILSPLMAISVSFPVVIVAGLDHRYGWTAPFPTWAVIAGFILIAAGYGLASWALAENSFFSGVVRIQKDRGHSVCDTGPYRIVRHPGYTGSLIPLAGIVLALSSIWTIIPAVIALVITIIRTALEDRTLQEELPGYSEYAQRVRYRLFPGIY